MALDHALANLVAAKPIRNAKMTLLLDPDGKLLTSYSAAGGRGGGDAFFRLLPAADIAKALKSNEVGFIETDRLGAPHVLAFDTIEPVKWTLVSVIEESLLTDAPIILSRR